MFGGELLALPLRFIVQLRNIQVAHRRIRRTFLGRDRGPSSTTGTHRSVVGKQQGLDRFYAAVGRCADKRGRQQDAIGHGEGALKMAKLVGTLCDDRAMVWVWLVLWRIVLSHSDNQRAQNHQRDLFFFDEHPLSRHGDLLQIWAVQVMGSWRLKVPTSSRGPKRARWCSECKLRPTCVCAAAMCRGTVVS